jgi:AcrR family transcriptional regulator
MSPRRYALKQRAEAAQETRQRIVAATMALHTEQGVLATSHKDIAARADVSVGTVYHHFPTRDAIVRACGTRIREMLPPPSAEDIDARAPRRQRVAALVRALVAFYARMPWLEKLRSERHEVPALDLGMTMREEATRQLIRRALGRPIAAKKIAVTEAILDPAVVNRLLESGISQKEAAATLASILNAWLEGGRS